MISDVKTEQLSMLDIFPDQERDCLNCSLYHELWDKNELIKALKWILSHKEFGFGTDWPMTGSKPMTAEENAGYIIQRTIDYLEFDMDDDLK